MYVCQSYVAPVKHDTLRTDSTRIISDEEVILDENGEPISKPAEQQQGAADEQKAKSEKKTEKKHKATEEQINLDNL